MKTSHILAAVAVASCVALVVMNRNCQQQCHADSQAAEQIAQIQTGRDVVLQTSGADKAQAVKELQSLFPALSETEATSMVENTPAVIAKSVSDDDANRIKAALETIGAQVVVS